VVFIEWAFAIILAAAAIGLLLPRGLFLFRPSGFRYYFEDEESNTSMKTFHKSTVKDLAEKIAGLGFSELGVKVERFPLWGSRTEELSLASNKDQAFAAITVFRNTPTFHFITPFTGGQIVITSPGSFKNIDEEGFLSAAAPGDAPDPAEVLEKHKENVAGFVSKGYVPFREYTRETRMEGAAIYYNSRPARGKARRVGAVTFIAFVVMMFPLVLTLINLAR
jgi:hypothetical protein